MSNTSRIKSITVKGLFNHYDHTIELNHEQHITILHGINGVGKTTILRMINALFNIDIVTLHKIYFNEFSVELSNSYKITIKRFKVGNGSNIEIYIDDNVKVPWLVSLNSDIFNNKENSDSNFDGLINGDELVITKDGNKTRLDVLKFKLENIPVQFIEVNRLIHITNQKESHQIKNEVKNSIEIYASELQKNIKNALANYAKKSQELEQTFPFRLLKTTNQYNLEQLKEQIELLQTKRNALRDIGLITVTDTVSASLDESSIDSLETQYAVVMSVYIDDSEEKLKILEPLSKKIQLLLQIINSKFYGKKLKIDENKGLIVITKEGSIDLSLLSSGEQHEIVMFYDLIFKVEPNTLVMIDEPELSLHISWQHKFIDELKEIVENANYDVLIATHSPTIVGQNAQLMVALGTGE